jgi:hypothetical protein
MLEITNTLPGSVWPQKRRELQALGIVFGSFSSIQIENDSNEAVSKRGIKNSARVDESWVLATARSLRSGRLCCKHGQGQIRILKVFCWNSREFTEDESRGKIWEALLILYLIFGPWPALTALG